jgi:hypothetical protein
MDTGPFQGGPLPLPFASPPPGREQLRLAAATLALRRIETADRDDDGERPDRRTALTALLHDADRVYAWLTAPAPPASITLTAGPITDQRTGAVATTTTGADMALELGDSQQVTITAAPRDAEGQPTTDTITWTVDNTTAVQALQVSGDTLEVTLLGATPATGVTLTATDASGNSAPFVFDVVSGPATSLGLTAGPVTDQPAPAPAA